MTRPSSVPRRLVPYRGLGLAVAGVAWLALLVMALWVEHSSAPKGIDASVMRWLYDNTGTTVQQTLLALSEPVLTVGGCAVVAICALLARRWDVAALAVVGPLAGLGLESHVFKPMIGRTFGIVTTLSKGQLEPGYAFPSGHETGLVSLAGLLVILLLAGPLGRGAKAALTVVAAAWMILGALGLVRSGYHYFTDTLGGIALGVGLMTTVALVIDEVTRRVNSPAGPDRTRTAPAA